jgi:hypothetical protein
MNGYMPAKYGSPTRQPGSGIKNGARRACGRESWILWSSMAIAMV